MCRMDVWSSEEITTPWYYNVGRSSGLVSNADSKIFIGELQTVPKIVEIVIKGACLIFDYFEFLNFFNIKIC